MATRYVLDCREHPSDAKCTVTIAGTAEEVLTLGAYHAVTQHGMKDDKGLRKELRSMLKEEAAAMP